VLQKSEPIANKENMIQEAQTPKSNSPKRRAKS